ncbi:MAG TPA: polysaccharide deacetylase family protein, partial [Nitrospirota bacterium]
TTGWIDAGNHLTAAQIIALRDAGWEIMSHTVSHPNLRSLTAAEIETELSKSKNALEALGVTIHNLVYPYNKSNEQVRQIARKYYRSGRGGGNEANGAFIDPYELRSFTSRQDLAKIEKAVDRANAEKSWMIIYHHDIDAKITLTNKKGTFSRGEQLVFSPSGAQGRYIRDAWFLSAGFMHMAPLTGTPRPGDTIVGRTSGASARLSHVAFNDREMISELLHYVRVRHPDMKIVTIDQALDILGIPKQDASSHE